MSHFAHPIPAEWLTAYHDGELDARRRQQVEAHLPECAECQRELEAMTALRQALLAAELPPSALPGPEAFWRGVQAQLAERQPAKPARAPLTARRVLLHWSPGIALLVLNGLVQAAAVLGVSGVMLAAALQWTPAWLAPLLQAATGFTLGWPVWLLPANWGGWGLVGFWLIVSAELAVLYLAWLGYELRYGPFAPWGGAAAARGV